MGYRPRGTQAAHIGVPFLYEVGVFSDGKALGLQLRREHGSWASRRIAACIYAEPLGYRPRNSDSQARPPRMSAPPPFENSKDTAHAQQTRKLSPPDNESHQAAALRMDLDDTEQSLPTAPLKEEIITPDRDSSDCPRKPSRANVAAAETPPASTNERNTGKETRPNKNP